MKGATGEISHQFATLLSPKEDIHRKFVERDKEENGVVMKKKKNLYGV